MATVATLTEDFATGTAGNPILTTNTIFDSETGAGANATFTTDTVSTAMRNAPGGADFRLYRADFTSAATMWFGFYITIDTLPTSNTAVCLFYNGTTKIGDVRITTTGQLQLRSVNSTVWTSTAITTGTRHRVAVQVAPTAGGTGTLRLRTYQGANANGSTPSQDSGAQTAAAAVAGSTNVRFGTGSADATLVYRLARIRGDNATEPAGIASANQVPIASAGADQAVSAGQTVTLSGSGSSDPDGTVASYSWTQTGGSPTVTLSGTGASRTFTAPTTTTGAALTFSLTVIDNLGASSNPDTVTISVAGTGSGSPTNIAALSEDFTGGTGNIALSPTTIFDSTTGAGTASTFSTDSGLAAMRTAPGGTDFKSYRADFTATDVLWLGFYFTIDTIPTTSVAITSVYLGTDKVADVRIMAGTSTLQLRSVNSDRWVSAPVTVGTRHRLTLRVAPTVGGTGTLRLRLFEGAARDNSAPTQDSTPVVAAATVASVDNIRVGAASADATLVWRMSRLRGDSATEPAGSTIPNVPPTAILTGPTEALEPGQAFTLTVAGTDPDTGATITSYTVVQKSGPTTALTGTGTTPRAGSAPYPMFGTNLVYGLTVTDDKGANSVEDTVQVQVLPHNEHARVGGVWRPLMRRTK